MVHLLRRQIQSPLGIIPFVGAGMSVSLGFPTWTNFLLAQSDLSCIKNDVAAFLANGKYEEAAEALRLARGDLRFNDTLSGQFDRDLSGVDASHTAIAYLPMLASGPVITTNFDTVLEHVFSKNSRPFDKVILGRRVDNALEQLALNRRLLIKLHGECAFPQDRVLTLSEYEAAYGGVEVGRLDLSLQLPNLLKVVLQSRPLLFIGCSLVHDRTIGVISAVAQSVSPLVHYAIVAAPRETTALLVRDKFLADLGIRPIWYPEGQHDSIMTLLDHLLTRQTVVSCREAQEPEADKKRSVALADQLNDELAHVGCDIKSLNFRQAEEIRRTKHSRIYRGLSADGTSKIIKFTTSDFASLDALRQITGQSVEVDQYGLRATVCIPLWSGRTRSEVVELLPFVEGIPIELVRLRSPSPFQGDLLAQIFNALLRCANGLHEMGVLHRDITPSNILLSSVGEQAKIALIDLSFACQIAVTEQVPTSSGPYTAPEQAAGAAVPVSDFYSIAATCFFLATGNSPSKDDQILFDAGVAAIDFGDYHIFHDYKSSKLFPKDLIRLLLQPDPNARPSDHWRLVLQPTSSGGFGLYPIVGILDFGEYGIATIHEDGAYCIVKVTPELLRGIEDKKLRAFLQKRQRATGR